jgi:hypothetical protein
LPHELHTLLLYLFKLLWRTGTTPTQWQRSATLLFFKRTPATNPANYRPIAIHDTLFKLWTRLVTHLLQNYLEEYGILTCSQEGARPGRSTAQALQYLTLLLEDAKLHKRDIFTLDADLQDAFNSMDHRCLFLIMEQLGVPPDGIAAVQGIYSQATTTITTPHGSTPLT